VYSASKDSPGENLFHGFCLGFAHPTDILRLTEGDAGARDRIVENISPYFLPVPLYAQDDTVRRFAADGFATVIRLPLKTVTARQEVMRRFHELEDSKAPILLFLERVSRLTLELVDGNNSRQTSLLRKTQELTELSVDSGLRYEVVDLAEQGQFFLASLQVDYDGLIGAVRSSVAADQLDESWLEWRDDAWVTVAVRLDRELDAGRLYTFLPMEHATAFFHGHMNAPFYTKLARMGVSEEVYLNNFLLDRIADLCAETTIQIAQSDLNIAPVVVSDLLLYSAGETGVMHTFDDAGWQPECYL